jgi:hypothetical protein
MNFRSPKKPASSATLTAYAAAALTANAATINAMHHVFRTAGYDSIGATRYLLIWMCAINIASAGLLLAFGRYWRHRFSAVAALDLSLSLAVFVLIRTLRIAEVGPRTHAIALVYTAFVFLKCFTLVLYSVVNAGTATCKLVRAWVLLASLVVYMGFVPWVARATSPTGDEPHYLILTQSLIADHDFNLANNYSQRDYGSFYPGKLDRHVIKMGAGQELPIHDFGLSILLIPGYGIGNRTGALVELSLAAALTALGMFELAVQVGAELWSALLVWGMFAFTMPLVVYASQLYPEVVGAAGMLWAVVVFVRFTRDRRISWLWLSGIMLAVLPWFSVRFWTLVGPLLAVMATFAVWQELLATSPAGSWKRCLPPLSSLGVPMAVSLAVFATFDFSHYGMLLPNAGYVLDLREQAIPVFTHQPHIGLLGLFLDRAHGLLAVAPVYILVLAGSWKLAKHNRVLAASVLVPSMVYIAFTSFNRYWAGGWCPPGRFLVVPAVLCAPLAVLPLRNGGSRWIAIPTTAWTVFVAFVEMAFPALRFIALPDVTRTGLSMFLKQGLGFDPLTAVFPSLVRAEGVDFVVAAVWVGFLAACIYLLVRCDEKPGVPLASHPEHTQMIRGASTPEGSL